MNFDINSDEVVINKQGGSQSKLVYRFDLFDPVAMFRLASILHQGAEKYGDNNWRKISQADHINHALTHINAYLGEQLYGLPPDAQEDHLGHALCRIMFAIGVEHDTTA